MLDEPAGGLEPEGSGKRLLQECARRHDRRPMSIRERRGCGSRPIEVREDEVQSAPRDQHHGRVEDVLAGRAMVHIRGGFVRDRGAQGIDQRDHRVGASDGRPAELRDVELVNAALSGNAFGRHRWDEANP